MASLVCKILGVVFLLVGLVGFFFAPSQSPGGEMMGFGLNLSHNLVHILSGALVPATSVSHSGTPKPM